MSTIHVNLVDNRYNLKTVINCHVKIADSLCLNTLRGINDKQSALASSYRTRDFIGEINMSWCVDEVKRINFTIESIVHLNSMALNGDATLSF